ncbi:MAG TPA: helix-turn-helix domain-containing protein [Methylomirabilota bacterium]|nr:helix-turn-helix domain-containing protein [Methylomirabilota bacterium]
MGRSAAARTASAGAVDPREARRLQRRARLTQAALAMFAARGYHETSVDDIVARARMSKSAFYEQFDSKEQCFREVLAKEGGELIHAVIGAAAGGHDHRDRMRRGIRAFVVACYKRSAVARMMLVESVGLSASVEEVRHQLEGRFAHMVAEEVRSALLDDAFYANQDPVVFGRSVVGAVNDAVSYFLTHPGADAESLADSLCRIFAP